MARQEGTLSQTHYFMDKLHWVSTLQLHSVSDVMNKFLAICNLYIKLKFPIARCSQFY